MPVAQLRRGCRPIAPAKRPHMPWEAMSARLSTCGTRGQKIQRPNSTRNAGRNVSITPTVQAMPIAQTGPRLRSELSWLNVRQSRAMITVAAEAAMAGAALRQAFVIAATRLSQLCSSSR